MIIMFSQCALVQLRINFPGIFKVFQIVLVTNFVRKIRVKLILTSLGPMRLHILIIHPKASRSFDAIK